MSACQQAFGLHLAALFAWLVVSGGLSFGAPDPGTAPAGGEDWCQYLGPNRNAVNEGPKLATEWPAGGPPVVWRVKCAVGHAGVMVKDGVVVLMEREARRQPPRRNTTTATSAPPVPLPDEVIRGLDANTGEELWRQSFACQWTGDQYTWGPCATPAGVGDKVVCLGIGGRLRGLEQRTGKLLWEKDLVEEYGITKKGGHAIYDTSPSPVIVGDLVVLQLCAGQVGLVAFGVDDGREAWRTAFFSNYGASPGFMRMGDTPVVIAMPCSANRALFRGGDVLGFNGTTGQFMWSGNVGKTYYNTPPPIANDGMVVVEGGGGDGPTFALRPPESDEGKATVLWKDADHLARFSNYVIYRGMVFGQGYFGHPKPNDHKLFCADAKDGTLCWEYPVKESHQMMLASDGKIIQLHENGELSMFDGGDRTGYRELARAKVLGRTWSFPALVRGRLYVRSDSEVECLDLCAK